MAEVLTKSLGRQMTAADLSVVFSLGNATGFITMIGGGFLNQRIGPKWVIFSGGVLFGLGFVICGFAESVTGLIVGYGLFSGLAMGLAYGCTISNSVKFFPDKAGLAGGIATASYGISSVIIPPAANTMINSMGVNRAFITLGIVIVVVVCIFSQFIIKCPEGFVPKGWTPAVKKETGGGSENRNWKEMMRMPVFYIMLGMLFCGAVLGMMMISQASSLAQDLMGMSSGEAAIVVSVLALFNTFGRIAVGMISDRIGCVNTLTGVFAVALISMGALYANGSGSRILFYAGICLIGVCFGAFMGVYPSFTAGQFGAKYSSVNYGIMFIGFNAAGLLGPVIMGNIFNSTGSYRGAFLVALAFAVVGILLSFVFRKSMGKA